MKHIMTYNEMTNVFRKRESEISAKQLPPDSHIVGYIVFTNGSFNCRYPDEYNRTYVVSSNNKAFIPGMGGYSIYGSSLDGMDRCLRMENYIYEECCGGTWHVDYCYMLDDGEKPDVP